MKQTLENYIRKDKKFQQLVLKLDGSIIKYWAERSDKDFDADLFISYEKQIIEDYLLANNQNRTVRSLPTDKLRDISLNWYHQTKGSELKLLVALKPELMTIDVELFEQVLNYVERYMEDAYKESRRLKYPDGIPPKDFYDEVVKEYGFCGLSLDCLERVLQEYRGTVVNISTRNMFQKIFSKPIELAEWNEVNNLQTEFDIKMFLESCYTYGAHRKFRQAVKEIIDNGTKNLTNEESRETCLELAKDEMKKFYKFTLWVNNETYPVEKTEGGKIVPLITSEERHWLRHDILYVNAPGATGTQKLTTMQEYFVKFISILQEIGSIWAAQLLRRGIDMKELEKETGIILSRHSGFLYYVDRYPDEHRGDCCVYDWPEAKKLLAKVKRIKRKILTWEEEKQCFKDAVLSVMEEKRKNGDYFFEKPTHWIAVYRVAVDCGVMYDMGDPNEPQDKSKPQYTIFEKLAHELQFDDNSLIRVPFTKKTIDSIQKPNYVRYNAPYPWSKDGLTLTKSLNIYSELEDIYKLLKVKHRKLVCQAERSSD